MIRESKYVSGVNFDVVFGRTEEHIKEFANDNDMGYYTTDFDDFLNKVDAVIYSLLKIPIMNMQKKL